MCSWRWLDASRCDAPQHEADQTFRLWHRVTFGSLKLRPVWTLQPQHRARVVRRRHLVAELLDQAPRLRHLLGVAFGELAAADEEAVFEANARSEEHTSELQSLRHLVC